MIKAGAIALALSALLTAAVVPEVVAGARGADNPHASIFAEGSCQECHLEQITWTEEFKRPLRFKGDTTALCLGCHADMDLGSLHPVDIRPAIKVPESFPLDERGRMNCATCHNPHSDFEASAPYVPQTLTARLSTLFSSGNKYRTYFLRAPNADGELCRGCHPSGSLENAGIHLREPSLLDQYVGSARCGECHVDKYREWQLTPHARMVSEPDKNPEMVLGDFNGAQGFSRKEVVYTLGTHWAQSYVVDVGGSLHAKAPLWSIADGRWEPGHQGDKPWGLYCQGCHTTGFEFKDEPRFSELGVGCEACHGPGAPHAQSEGAGEITNPAKLTAERGEMICQSCHTSGHDRTGQFRFPVGFIPGRDLTDYFKGLVPKAGQGGDTFLDDDSSADRSRQWEYWKGGVLNLRGASCNLFSSVENTQLDRDVATVSVSGFCTSCHDGTLPKARLHESHIDGGVDCHKCHIPSLAPDAKSYSVHDHKFFFGKPKIDEWKPPERTCRGCHEG